VTAWRELQAPFCQAARRRPVSNGAMVRSGAALLVATVFSTVACGGDGSSLPPVPPAPGFGGPTAPVDANPPWAAQVRRFLTAVRPVVGDDPVECNSRLRAGRTIQAAFGSTEAPASWFDCAATAQAASKPFIVLVRHTGVDSWAFTGVLGRRTGDLYAFFYEDGMGQTDLQLAPCLSPTARTDGTGLFGLRCANEDESGRVDMTEGPFQLTAAHADLSRQLLTVTGAVFVDCSPPLEWRPIAPWMSAAALEAALRCGEAAKASSRPFRVIVHRSSVDSFRANGLASTPEGDIRYFAFNSREGDEADTPALFWVQRCSYPTVEQRYAGPDFGCGDRATVRAPPSRRRRGS